MTESGKIDSRDTEQSAKPQQADAQANAAKKAKSSAKSAPDTKAAPEKAGAPKQQAGGDKGGNTGSGSGRKSGSGRGALLIALLALLIALASAAGVAAMWYRGQMQLASVSERVDTVERGLESSVQDLVLPRVQQLANAQDKLQRGQDAQREKLAKLQSELTQSRVQVGELVDKVEGGRRRWQLLEIQDLLLAANERLLLYKDASGAQQALSIAGARLGDLNDPRLFKVREQVVNEIAALNALPKPDIEGMALTLTSLIELTTKLPLAADVPHEYNNDGDYNNDYRLSEPPLAQAPWEHFLTSMRQALNSMVTIRRENAAYKPLMPPEQEFFLIQNLQLKLQSARLALLEKKSQTFSESLAEARDWLRTFFDKSDPAVAGAIETLGRLENIELAWDAPDISDSLEALKAYLQGQSAADQNGQPQTGAKADAASGSE